MRSLVLLSSVFCSACRPGSVTEALASRMAALLRASPNSGAIQLDAQGHPLHLAEPGKVWNLVTQPQGTDGFAASLPESRSVTLPGSYEPNLHYGTLQLKDGTLLDKSPSVPFPSASDDQSGRTVYYRLQYLDRMHSSCSTGLQCRTFHPTRRGYHSTGTCSCVDAAHFRSSRGVSGAGSCSTTILTYAAHGGSKPSCL